MKRNVFEPVNKMVDENDPDRLQLLDELDNGWVKLWSRATNMKKSTIKEPNIQSCSAQKSTPANLQL